jgi:hypothetical protein
MRKGFRPRVTKKFPGGWGRNGLKREVKVFWLQKAREGKRPTILDAAKAPFFTPATLVAQVDRDEQRAAAEQFARELAERRAAAAGTLFDTSPDGLPD